MSRRSQRIAAEAVGSAFLLMGVVGSGIMGDRLAGGNVAIALVANSVATGCVLGVLIFVLGPLSGAHFNPAVTLVTAGHGNLERADVIPYVGAQIGGAVLGVAGAHLMFGLPAVTLSTHARTGLGQWTGEVVATFGLLCLIRSCQIRKSSAAGVAIGTYIVGAYWFTSSTSFANPAVTIARMLTDTFTGIRPADVGGFIAAQALGAGLAWLVCRVGS